jgi:hypothetical protein
LETITTQIHSANIHPESTVIVDGGVVRFIDFIESDPDVLQIILEAVDPEAAAHSVLGIGAQSVRIASTNLDTELVERRFAGLANAFDKAIEDAVNRLADNANELLDEETGVFPKVITGVRDDLEQLLGETFDADSKSSVIAKIENVQTDSAQRLARTVKSTFDLDEPASPLARTKRELVEVVKDEVGIVVQEVRSIATAMATNAAADTVARKLSTKGTAFEDLIGAGLEQIGSIHGDIIRHVGRTTGSAGTKKGDLLVTLCLDDTCGHETGFVLEAKDRPLSMSKTLAELDTAAANHEASAAIAVFAGIDLAPVSLPFWYSGSRAILIFDRDEPDIRALQLAYQWARWVTRRSLIADTGEPLNITEIEAAIGRALQALTIHQTIKSCLSAIKKKADEAGLHVTSLVNEVDQAISSLKELLGPRA